MGSAEGLTDENIRGLLSCLPTPDEVKMLKNYKGEVSALANVEQFMLEVRIQAMLDDTFWELVIVISRSLDREHQHLRK